MRRGIAECMKAQIRLPLFNRRIGQHRVDFSKEFGRGEREPVFTAAPCALKNAPQSRRGVMALASSTLTKWYRFSGSRSSAGKSETFARRVSNANTCAA